MADYLRRTFSVRGEWKGEFIRTAHFEMPLGDGPSDQNDVTERCWATENPALVTSIIPYVDGYMKHQPSNDREGHGSAYQRALLSLLEKGADRSTASW